VLTGTPAVRTIIVNCKNYPEVLGDGAVLLGQAVAAVSGHGIEAIIAPPTPMLSTVSSSTKARVFSQDVGTKTGDKTTGAVLPEAVRAAGAVGTILNHSESRKDPAALAKLVPRLSGLGLDACVCAKTSQEAARLSRLRPRYVAIEPPELIGTGVAVSRAKPDLIRRTVAAVRRAGYEGGILCGAGIVTGEDVKRAVELGSDGVLVASSVVKARDWGSRVRELADSLK
jgi:triosephosphate isomerase (TIM)